MKHRDELGYSQGYSGPVAEYRMERRARRTLGEFKPDASLLELGCGSGEFTRKLLANPIKSLLAVDRSEKLLKEAQSQSQDSRLQFLKTDLSASEFYQKHLKSFDGVVGNGILHHLVGDLDKILPQLSLVLKPGGRLVFWEPNLLNPYVYLVFKNKALRRWAGLEPEEMAFSPSFIQGQLEKQGFKAEIQFLDFLLPNTPSSLVKVTEKLGSVLEKSPLRILAQSLFIVASKR